MNAHIENAMDEMDGVLEMNEMRHLDAQVADAAEKVMGVLAGLSYVQAHLALQVAMQAIRTGAVLPT